MTVQSLGFHTDLMLLRLQGSTVERHAGHLTVRTPSNPGYRWGNFLLLDDPPQPGTAESWIRTFQAQLPGAGHVALGLDRPDCTADEVAEFAAAGLGVDQSAVLTAREVRQPTHRHQHAQVRRLVGDDDWRAALALREANNTSEEPGSFLVFAERRLRAMRQLQQRGFGAWFGAFLGRDMVSGLGVFTDGSGLARFQSVDTHPEHRRQGLAGTLVHAASRYARDTLGATTLVMVADPDDVAIRLYRSAGFSDRQTQVQMQRSTG